MTILGRVLGAFNVLAAAVVFVNVISGHAQLWNTGALWDYINPIMAVAVVISLLVNLRRKISLSDEDGVSRTYLEVNILFYASIILTMVFVSNWTFMLWGFDDASDSSKTRHFIYWWFINPFFILVSGITGRHIWLKASRM